MLFFYIFFPLLVAVGITLFSTKVRRDVLGWIAFAVPVILFALFAWHIPTIASFGAMETTFSWIPTYGIDLTFILDGLSLIFVLLITGVGALVILYSIFYLSLTDSFAHFYTYLLLFMTAMLGVVLSDSIIVLYVFWELTSISSFLLIAFWFHRKNSRNGAIKSLLITMAGGFAMLAGFLMLHVITDSFSLRTILSELPQMTDHALFYPAMGLILIGAFTKSAQFPFHIWLPDAMEAPTPVSAYLHSATMVKAGIYLIARFTPGFGGDIYWFWVITIIGLITLFWGSFNAVRQNDLKALLAFSTISQLGLIMTLLGIGSASLNSEIGEAKALYTFALFTALFHLVNHSTFKGALFMVVGIVDHQVGTRDLRRLGGLMRFLPITFALAIIGSFAMAGLPFFNGFLSKEMFLTAVLSIRDLPIYGGAQIGWLIVLVAWVASLFTFVYSMILVFRTFTGRPIIDEEYKRPQEASIGMLISPSILASFVIGLFFFPNILSEYLLKPALEVLVVDGAALAPKIYAWHGFNTELLLTAGIVLLGSLAYLLLKKWRPYYQYIPSNWSFNTLFRNTLTGYERLGERVTTRYMNGNLPSYFLYIFSFFIIATWTGWFLVGPISFSMDSPSSITVYEGLLAVAMAAAAIAILFAQSRLTAILLNGVLGFSIAIFFVFFRAPDLALTQLVIEAVTTVLFLVCFNYLPEWKVEKLSLTKKVRNGLIAAFGGLTVTIIGLAVNNYSKFDTISTYYEDSYELAGGRNIVNAILGDFRAFDTMLEGLVLFIAGIGVFTLIRMRQKKGAEPRENQ
ncbi:Na+/H+ antiporter subunit A [Chryseomicrobium sp. FSL W7-1435]|uniref:Na+/H+ antiporter subunit A n=1 Tax=Chryseomicrobium sp. FSL W7-1435 TaxID=2921704 RepID=UPI003159F02A